MGVHVEVAFEGFFKNIEIGYFLVWLCIDGEWRIVEVDGYLPVWPNGDRPAFSYSG